MASEDLTEKQFGYVVPPVCHHHHPIPPPPPPPAPPPGISMQDWMNYINAYIDVRARQMYEKLKELIGQGGGSTPDVKNTVFPYIKLQRGKGTVSGIVDVYVDENGTLCSDPESAS